MLAAIGRALQDVKVGNAFMIGDLEESDYERILEEEMLNKFFEYVSKSMPKSLNPKKSKKVEKQVLELLQSKRDMWVNEIRKCIQETSVDATKSETSGEPTLSLDTEKTTTEMPKKSKKRKSEGDSSPKSPKKKLPRWDTSTKKKKKSSEKSTATTLELEIVRAGLKKKFEEEKAQILAEVPPQHKSKWRQIGFGKWGKEWLPCMILSPYDVGAQSFMREEWMLMFENVSIQCSFNFLLYVRA